MVANSTSTAAHAQEQVAATFGKYRIIAALASGGMADVFLTVAHGPIGFNKLQVVKRLKRHLQQDPDFVAMFLDEARLAARLNHPNIVQTNEVGQQDGIYYLAMEYLEGQTLQRVVREHAKKHTQRLPLRIYVRILSEILGGLEYAHQLTNFDGKLLDFVHRDVTPHNVIVTYDGVAKLLDFGIAKAATNSNETRAGVLKGKVPYMAPEQVACDHLTLRADIYSVGVMLWEAVAGRRMWKGVDENRILRSVLKGDVPSLRDACPDAPPALVSACQRALETDPEKRFASAAEFQARLDAFLDAGTRLSNKDVGRLVDGLFKEERQRIRGSVDRQLAEVAKIPADAMIVPIKLSSPPPPQSSSDLNVPPYTPTSGSQPKGATASGPHTASFPTGHEMFTPGVPPAAESNPSSYGSGANPSSPSYGSHPNGAVPGSYGSQPGGSHPNGSYGSYPTPPPWKQPIWIATGVLALMAIFGIVLVLVAVVFPRFAAATHPPVAAASVAPPPPATAPPAPQPAPAAAPAANTVSISIIAGPPGCKLYLDDAQLPSNPFLGKFVKDGANHKIRVEAVGHESKSEIVTFDHDLNVNIQLKAVTASAAPYVPRTPSRPAAAATPTDDVTFLSGKPAPKGKEKPKLDNIQ